MMICMWAGGNAPPTYNDMPALDVHFLAVFACPRADFTLATMFTTRGLIPISPLITTAILARRLESPLYLARSGIRCPCDARSGPPLPSVGRSSCQQLK